MALNQFFSHILKLIKGFKFVESNYKAVSFRYLFYLLSVFIILIIYIAATNLIENKNQNESKNFDSLINTRDFSNLSDFFISKINSPYKEIKYLIKSHDSVEKILKKTGYRRE